MPPPHVARSSLAYHDAHPAHVAVLLGHPNARQAATARAPPHALVPPITRQRSAQQGKAPAACSSIGHRDTPSQRAEPLGAPDLTQATAPHDAQ